MPIIKESKSVEEYEALIERYKIQNPVKYARKKKELAAKLDKLKHPVKEDVEEVPVVVEPKKELVVPKVTGLKSHR